MTRSTDVTVTGLYVPGDRPERFDKAVVTGADLVILDLEDGVAADRKEAAREAVVEWLGRRPWGRDQLVEVRVNAGEHADLRAVAEVGGTGVGVRLPKVESPGAIEAAIDALGYTPRIAAVIETAAGVEELGEIAAHPAARTLSLGEADLASDLGTNDQAVLDWARLRLLFAARACGKPAPMMSVYTDIRDLDGLRADTLRGKAMGFVGRTAIHPSQLPAIATAFIPTESEVAWAREVLAVTEAGGVTTLESGEMVDPAMRGRAETILALGAAADRDRRT